MKKLLLFSTLLIFACTEEEDLPVANPCLTDSSQIDTDGDGVYNDMDLFPFNDTEWADSDGDGVGDSLDDCKILLLDKLLTVLGVNRIN